MHHKWKYTRIIRPFQKSDLIFFSFEKTWIGSCVESRKSVKFQLYFTFIYFQKRKIGFTDFRSGSAAWSTSMDMYTYTYTDAHAHRSAKFGMSCIAYIMLLAHNTKTQALKKDMVIAFIIFKRYYKHCALFSSLKKTKNPDVQGAFTQKVNVLERNI